MKNKSAIVALADGTVLEGISVGALGTSVGEIVFNTSMTGYQEMLTDPSYARQIITLTTPHIGNTGINFQDYESQKIWASGLIVRNYTKNPSNYRSEQSLPEWLKEQGVVAISDIDTRKLTLKIRDVGSISGCISTDVDSVEEALTLARSFNGLEHEDLAKVVSRKHREIWNEGRKEWALHTKPKDLNVIVYDFGVKHSILRILVDLGCNLTLVPAETPVNEVLDLSPDGIFFSNGPGDPAACDYAIAFIKQFLEKNIPIFGICLGFQLLALACNGKSKKMKFGHHGANHPVIEINDKKRIFITSQNHGFSVDELSLPETLKVTHRSLFDNSLQGIKHRDKPAFGFQGHPEASPGPHDMEIIFEDFIQACKLYKNNLNKK